MVSTPPPGGVETDLPMSDAAAIVVGEDEHSNGSMRDAGHMNTDAKTMVELRGVSKTFGDVVALDDVSLSIRDGEFFTLLGPSGSGKTTVLRIVAGLIEPDSGEVLIGGTSMRGVPTFERELAVVFQSLALFPHMTVSENIAFSLAYAPPLTGARSRRLFARCSNSSSSRTSATARSPN